MKYKKINAKKISYSDVKRSKKDVKYIVIHYTGNRGDTAAGNGNYFKNSNERAAGAHFFIDRKGEIVKSIPMNRTAWSVGGKKYEDCAKTGGGTYYGVCTNANSVSIELCDIIDKYPSEEQIKSTKACIKYIRKYCPNVRRVIRHFDVTGKSCPDYFINEKRWKKLKKDIGA